MKTRGWSALAIASVMLLYVRVHATDGPNEWYYGLDGEDNWDEQCGGERQSPVNIMPMKVQKQKATLHDSQLIFHNYNQPIEAQFQNNGHTIEIQVPKSKKINIEGGILNSFYRLVQIHFHWESEHTINSKRYPLEAHFVHIKSYTSSLDEALHKNEPIVVLAALFKLQEKDNEYFSKIAPTIRNINKIHSSNQTTVVPMRLLPTNTSSYFTYNGSLTTPPCSEIVTWIVFETPILISSKQWNIFKKSETTNGTNSSNYRRTVSIGTRTIVHVQPVDHKRFSRTKASVAQHPVASAIVLSGMLGLCLSKTF